MTLQVLVVDECSMVDAEYLDHLSIQVGSVLHYHEAEHSQGGSPDADLNIPEPRSLPFGGEIQLIFCGDFLQVSSCIWMGSNTMSLGPSCLHRNPPPASARPVASACSSPQSGDMITRVRHLRKFFQLYRTPRPVRVLEEARCSQRTVRSRPMGSPHSSRWCGGKRDSNVSS